jgi:hypothetical protein
VPVCCRLAYRSQYAPGPVAARKERPGLYSECWVQGWEWNPAKSKAAIVTNRYTRRRL